MNSAASSAPASSAQAPQPLVEQALTLLARAASGDTATEANARTELQRWRDATPAHARAAAEAERHWARAGRVAGALVETQTDGSSGTGVAQLLARIDTAARERRARSQIMRRAAKGVAALAMVLGVGLTCWIAWQQPNFEATLGAVRGHQLVGAKLPDGSVLDLDADTSVAVRYSHQRRDTILEHGRLRLDVAREHRSGLLFGSLLPTTRPFVVHTRVGRVEVLGTAFTVSDRAGVVHVVVERGRVRVATLDTGHAPAALELHADQAVRIEPDGSLGTVTPVAGADAAAWRQGWLSFDGVPLSEAVAQFEAYQGGGSATAAHPRVTLDPAAAGLRITGRFRAGNPSAFAATLPAVLPVTLQGTPGQAPVLHITKRPE